ncbi:MAG TPA: hypothetical protein VGA04_19780 [Streptosporangiaceae bacterium]
MADQSSAAQRIVDLRQPDVPGRRGSRLLRAGHVRPRGCFGIKASRPQDGSVRATLLCGFLDPGGNGKWPPGASARMGGQQDDALDPAGSDDIEDSVRVLTGNKEFTGTKEEQRSGYARERA